MNEFTIIEKMAEIEEMLQQKFNADFDLVGYGDYLGTFKNYTHDVQNEILSNSPNLQMIFDSVETHQCDYFDVVFN